MKSRRILAAVMAPVCALSATAVVASAAETEFDAVTGNGEPEAGNIMIGSALEGIDASAVAKVVVTLNSTSNGGGFNGTIGYSNTDGDWVAGEQLTYSADSKEWSVDVANVAADSLQVQVWWMDGLDWSDADSAWVGDATVSVEDVKFFDADGNELTAGVEVPPIDEPVDPGATEVPDEPTASDPVDEPTTSDEPVTSDDPTTSDDPVTSDDPTTSGTTSEPTTSEVEVAPIEVEKVAADVKAGETTKVEAGVLGEVEVAIDKEDAALEGAKVEISATNKEETVKTNIETAVGENATEETKAKVQAAIEAVKTGDAFTLDIGFTKDGKNVQPGKEVSITVALPDAFKSVEKLFIYHVSDAGIEDVTAKCTVKDGNLTIKNDKFSPYIISKVELKAKADGNNSDVTSDATSGAASDATSGGSTTSDGTNTNPGTGIALAVAPVILAGAAVVVISKKRK